MGSGVFGWLVWDRAWGIWFWTCARVLCAVCFVRVCACMRVLLGLFACLKKK